MDLLAKELGYRSDALVHKNAEALVRHGFISQVAWPGIGGTHGTEVRLLTDLGMALLSRIEKYNEFKEASRSATQMVIGDGLAPPGTFGHPPPERRAAVIVRQV